MKSPTTSVDTSQCVLWKGFVDGRGYGRRTVDNKHISAHRMAYIEAHGSIPEGMQVRHLCHNKLCINPEHLEVGTAKQNAQDRTPNPDKDECINGHEFTAENTWEYTKGTRNGNTVRVCKQCRRDRRQRLKGGDAK